MALVRVRYVGLSDVRTITAKQLLEVGVLIDKDLEWTRNGVLTIDANERMIEVLKGEGHFQVSAVKDDQTETVVVQAETAEDDPAVVVDAGSGARSEVPENKRRGKQQ